jgi:hypothetical protein
MVQDFGRELSGLQFRSVEEQMELARRVLFDQQQRQCMVRLADARLPLALRTPNIEAASYASGTRVEKYLRRRFKRCKFTLTTKEAGERLKQKEAEISVRFLQETSDEPAFSGRRLRR